MMYWNNGHMSTGWGIVMLLGMLTFWTLIALAILWFVRSTKTPSTPTPHAVGGSATAGAQQILAERLARGEIEPEDYQTRLTALK